MPSPLTLEPIRSTQQHARCLYHNKTSMVSPTMMASLTKSAFLPLALLVSYSSGQYLATKFWSERFQWRVVCMLLCSVLAVLSLVPFANQSDATLAAMNDTSENALALLLYLETIIVLPPNVLIKNKLQITRMQRWTVQVAQYLIDLVVCFDLLVIAIEIVYIFDPLAANQIGGLRIMSNLAENVTLFLTFVLRFGFLAYLRGLKRMVQDDFWEIVWHVVFMTHEYPFMLLESYTSFSWEYAQALYQRVSITPCIYLTARSHFADDRNGHMHPLRRKSIEHKPSAIIDVSNESNWTSLVTLTSVETNPLAS